MTKTASDAESQAIYGKEPLIPVARVTTNCTTLDTPPDDDTQPQTNGHGGENGDVEEPPSKRRRVSEIAPKKKPESPPWRKAVAEGPSSFTQDGKRKSGRTNQIPLELQPPSSKRQTRGALQKSYSAKNKTASANETKPSFQRRDISTTSINGTRKSGKNASQQPPKSPPKLVSSPTRSHRKSLSNEQPSTPSRSHKKSTTPKIPQSTPAPVRPANARRSGRTLDIAENGEVSRAILPHGEVLGQSPKATLSRIKFLVKPPALPLPNPRLIPRPKQHASLEDFLEHTALAPPEDGGLFGPEDGPPYTYEAAVKDAFTLLRLEEAAEPGGLLSLEKCSAYKPEEQDQPPVQYSHIDHMNRAAVQFRKLMLAEHMKHKATAKRQAEACRDEWYRRQPKTLEQMEADKAKISENRYRSLIKTLQATWENVKAEVNRRRLLEWEAQEQARVRKALNEAVDMSTQKLQARRAQRDSEAPFDDEEEASDKSDSGESAASDQVSKDGESNMSSESEAEEDLQIPDAADDEQLSVEQLRAKYASIPSFASDQGTNAHDSKQSGSERGRGEATFDDSDESIDMNDDMGSSDGDRDSDDEESESDDGSEDEGQSSLLGFLAPPDLKSMNLDKTSPIKDEDEIDEEDEVSLVPDTTQAYRIDAEASISGNEDSARTGEDDIELTSRKESAAQPVPEVITTSPDQSSQPTPRTTDTRPSDIDSASSVEAHQMSRQVTQSATPQPSKQLETPVPFLLRGTLREYQHYGLDWLAGLYANNTNGILADEMGLGKTIQTIALLAHLACEHQVWGPHLVVVPTSVMLNWEMEFKKWCPGFKILTYYGNQDERKKKRVGWNSDNSFNVCITSYQLILQDVAMFKRKAWHYMILDEAHNIKNFQSQRWQAMLTFRTRARLLLTGTPLQNNLTELWSLLYFLMPSDGSNQGVGGFANLKEFQDWFKKPSEQILEHGRDQMDDEARAIITKLHHVLRPYLLRRLKADVEKQMPAKYEHVEFCRLSKRQRELYDSFLNREDTRGTLAGGNYLSIINCLMQLRKVCNHPDLFLDRPILTSFPMDKSAVADFEIKDLLVRRRLLREDPMTKASLQFLNLVPTMHEGLSTTASTRSASLSAQRVLMDMREAQRIRAQQSFVTLDPSTVKSNLVYLESASRWGRFEELQHCVYLNALRRQQRPIYGSQLIKLLSFGIDKRPMQPRPTRRSQLLNWLENSSPTLTAMVPTIASRSQALNTTIEKFACVTPPVIAKDITPLVLSPKGINTFKGASNSIEKDPFHEARMRLSIQFPDKRLLQYDCGKLQTLDKLLRKLQAGGHRALIFTQMTKVLDILEQFLNIHGHKYLRLDGATKIEQRQILTDRFNNDTRILAFILSSRSGGLGINLTGADTVIFYDLDWNPAMDKQCQDRCHRIGQTRDVHIYRLVSEHTIEANILRKANQKRMLDDVVIQEGEFTTDYFNKMSVRDVLGEDSGLLDGDAVANAAMDRVLGGSENSSNVQKVLAQAEDREDVAAARVAEREIVQTDAADFDENAVPVPETPVGPETPVNGFPTSVADGTPTADDIMGVDGERELNAWGRLVESIDDYMLKFMTAQLKDTPLELPKDKNKNKKGKDHRNRSHRTR